MLATFSSATCSTSLRLSSSSFCELIKRSKSPSSNTRCLQPASCKAVTVPISPIPKIEPLTQPNIPGYGGYYPSDEEIAADQARQQWYDDQVQWGIEQGYIDPNTGDYTGQ